MKSALVCAPLLTLIAVAPAARAATYYAAPSGSGSTCSQSAPCSLSSAAGKTNPGDTVVLADGMYGSLNVTRAGSASGWITYQAADGALPILQGSNGSGSGVNVTSSYIRFVGLVARNWSTGFGNKWTGGGTTTSNGNIQFVNCIADENSANGFAFRSAQGSLIQQCIAAHNGYSTTQSWSSGVDMFGVQGAPSDNVVERTVSFENVDMQVHSDGSGYIVDDNSTGVSFVNDIGFRNGGSCIRLTTTSNSATNAHIINNTCYGDGLDPAASGPSTPGEIFFSSAAVAGGVIMVNNLAVATGMGGDSISIHVAGTPTTNSNNVSNTSNTINFWADAAGTNPDFRLTAAASSNIVDKGTATSAPAVDIGFDPKCIIKATPTPNAQPWWIYSIDYTYIASVGGVAGCFHPCARPAGSAPDVGAYESGATPAPTGTGGSGGTTTGAGGVSGSGGNPGGGGSTGSGGSTTTGTGGSTTTTGRGGSGGETTGAGGTTATGSGGMVGAGGTTTTGNGVVPGTGSGTGGSAPGAAPGAAVGSCACDLGTRGGGPPLGLLLGAALLVLRRRRR